MNCGHPPPDASGRGASAGERTEFERLVQLDAWGFDVGEARIGADQLAKLLRVSVRTARRRLADWHRAPAGTAPSVAIRPDHRRRGRSSYFTSRAELARFYPEITDA